MATKPKNTKITPTEKPIQQRKTIKRYKVSAKDCEVVEALNQPFCDSYDIYLFLQDRQEINLSRAVFLRIVESNKDDELTRLEQRFKYAVSDLITRTNYNIYSKLYEQAQENPNMLVDYLKLYDRREREQTAKTKAYRGKAAEPNKTEASDSDFRVVNKNIGELMYLIRNPQPPNTINIPQPHTAEQSD